jgi:hypothetical protein
MGSLMHEPLLESQLSTVQALPSSQSSLIVQAAQSMAQLVASSAPSQSPSPQQ